MIMPATFLPKLQDIVFSSLLLVVLILTSQHASQATVMTSTSYYHGSLVLDFLCDSRSIPAFVRDVPWDCTSYVVCLRGRAFHTQCPGNKLYSARGTGRKCLPAGGRSAVNASRCQGQIFNHIDDICRANPSARIPSPDSCGHYVDCQARREQFASSGPRETALVGFMEGLLECSYPLHFSPNAGRCQHFSFVQCHHKFEPKAPCDYVQYLQLYNCDTANCTDCERHHPNCLSMADGFHPVPHRHDIMMKCQGERTVDFVTCPPGFSFPLPLGKGEHRHAPRCERG